MHIKRRQCILIGSENLLQKMFNRKEYIAQLIVILKEFKKLKEIRHISGDWDLLDELEQAEKILRAASYNWKTAANDFIELWEFYVLNSPAPKKIKEEKWNRITASLNAIWSLYSFKYYVACHYTLVEQLITELEKEDLKIK